METKWTPGPWGVFIDDTGGKWTGWPLSIYAAADTEKTVVRTGGQWPYEWDEATSQREAIANAHLIAAAPDLYAALMAVDAARFSDAMDDWEKATRMTDAALAKARGEA